MTEPIDEILKICDRHADRLNWAMTQLQSHVPFTGHTLKHLHDVGLAILDQFSTRFGLIQRDRFGVVDAQFHTAPATSYLRIYAPGVGQGEDLSSFREMMVGANKDHEPRKGVEIGREGVSIRAIDLVKDAEGYLGSFEVGMNFMTVLDNIKKNTGFEAGVFVDNDMMSRIATSLTKPDAERIVAGFRNEGATDWNIIKPLLSPELLISLIL